MKNIQKILAPVDFSEHMDRFLDVVKSMAQSHEADVTLFYVVKKLSSYAGFPIPHISLDVLEKELGVEANKRMNALVEKAQKDIPGVQGIVVSGDDVAEKIVSLAEKEKIDMIVMSTLGRSGLEKTFLGSVAEQVVRTATCPVLVVK